MHDSHTHAAFPLPGHDHADCVTGLVARAAAAFDRCGLRLTPLRQRVLEEVAGVHCPIGAYDIVERLTAKGRRVAPISIYRALDALQEAGLIHRLESRNAFFACHTAHEPRHRQLVLVCEVCGAVAEVAGEAAFASIDRAALASRFEPRATLVEVMGRCGHCASSAEGGAGHG